MKKIIKRFLALAVLVSFFVPGLKPLAYSGDIADVVHPTVEMNCEQMDNCPMRSVHSHGKAAAQTHGNNLAVKKSKDDCDTFFKCCKPNGTSKFSMPAGEMPFITGAASFHKAEPQEPHAGAGPGLYKGHIPLKFLRPPASVSPIPTGC